MSLTTRLATIVRQRQETAAHHVHEGEVRRVRGRAAAEPRINALRQRIEDAILAGRVYAKLAAVPAEVSA